MIKILIGFIVFAAIALFVLMKSGADVDMSGEKHGIDATHTESKPADAPAAAPAAVAPAAPASAPAEAPAK